MSGGTETPSQSGLDLSPSTALHPPTRVLYINNLRRPFSSIALHQYLNLADSPVTDCSSILPGNPPFTSLVTPGLWLAVIKDHAYAIYETESDAVAASQRVNNQIWPTEVGAPLEVQFVDPRAVPSLIAAEEAAWVENRQRLRLITSPGEKGTFTFKLIAQDRSSTVIATPNSLSISEQSTTSSVLVGLPAPGLIGSATSSVPFGQGSSLARRITGRSPLVQRVAGGIKIAGLAAANATPINMARREHTPVHRGNGGDWRYRINPQASPWRYRDTQQDSPWREVNTHGSGDGFTPRRRNHPGSGSNNIALGGGSHSTYGDITGNNLQVPLVHRSLPQHMTSIAPPVRGLWERPLDSRFGNPPPGSPTMTRETGVYSDTQDIQSNAHTREENEGGIPYFRKTRDVYIPQYSDEVGPEAVNSGHRNSGQRQDRPFAYSKDDNPNDHQPIKNEPLPSYHNGGGDGQVVKYNHKPNERHGSEWSDNYQHIRSHHWESQAPSPQWRGNSKHSPSKERMYTSKDGRISERKRDERSPTPDRRDSNQDTIERRYQSARRSGYHYKEKDDRHNDSRNDQHHQGSGHGRSSPEPFGNWKGSLIPEPTRGRKRSVSPEPHMGWERSPSPEPSRGRRQHSFGPETPRGKERFYVPEPSRRRNRPPSPPSARHMKHFHITEASHERKSFISGEQSSLHRKRSYSPKNASGRQEEKRPRIRNSSPSRYGNSSHSADPSRDKDDRYSRQGWNNDREASYVQSRYSIHTYSRHESRDQADYYATSRSEVHDQVEFHMSNPQSHEWDIDPSGADRNHHTRAVPNRSNPANRASEAEREHRSSNSGRDRNHCEQETPEGDFGAGGCETNEDGISGYQVPHSPPPNNDGVAVALGTGNAEPVLRLPWSERPDGKP